MGFKVKAEQIAASLTRDGDWQHVIAESIIGGEILIILIFLLIPATLAHGFLNFLLDLLKLDKNGINVFFSLVNFLLWFASSIQLFEIVFTCLLKCSSRMIKNFKEWRGELCILI